MGRVITVPAPVGGINARDSYASMAPTDAVYLRDYVPTTTDVVSAPPCELFLDQTGSIVRSLMPYQAGTASKLLMAAFGGLSWAISDITSGTPSSLASGFNGGVFVYSMFQSKLIMCNGADSPQVYDGAAVAAIVATGPTLANLRGVVTFKGRAYYWEKAAQKFWYAAAGAYQGTLTSFPIDTITSTGGKVMLLTTFTRDGGEGSDDLFVIVMDTGEVLIYQGDDPASAAAWELVGKFKVPQPIGVRSVFRWGARTFLVTTEGLIDLAQILGSSIYPLLSDKISESLLFVEGQTYNAGTTQADMVAPYVMPETNSLGVITMAQDASASRYASDGMFSHAVLSSGAWWDYQGLATFASLSSGAASISCACVWNGRTYYGFDNNGKILRPMIAQAALSGEEISQGWVPLSKNGYAFAFFPEPSPSNNDDLALKNFAIPANNEPFALSAYVQPFGGLTGNVAMVQNIVGTVANYWDGFDRKRWTLTRVRLKSGGTR